MHKFSFLAHEKIKPLSKEETDRLIIERCESFERKCNTCKSIVSNAVPFLRWQTMEFCDEECFDEFLHVTHGSICWACDSIIAFQNICVHTEYIHNTLRFFCSFECKSTYLQIIKMCEFCHKVLELPQTVGQQIKRFCSVECEEEHRQIFSMDELQMEAICTDCNMMKSVNVILKYQDKAYPFCSFTCFFFVKYSCGIYPGEKGIIL